MTGASSSSHGSMGFMTLDPEDAEVRAAGGVVWRRRDGDVEILVVHRPRYDDWSLPKGKLDPGESWEDAAVREVEEETGLRCRLGEELPSTSYRDRKGRSKVVRYWLMECDPGSEGSFVPNREIDALRWLPSADSDAVLSYPHDAELVRGVRERLAA
jgi:8-oxo-dGTP diphosphatase